MRKVKALLIATIALLVVLTPSALSQRSSVGKLFPVYNNGGKPDLVVDPQRFVSQMESPDADSHFRSAQQGRLRRFSADHCKVRFS